LREFGRARSVFISHKYGVIFVHIQRTGGNSINQLLRDLDPDLVEAIPIDPQKQRTRHCHLADIRAALDAATFDGFVKFCTVRNPFERLVSWYRALKDGFGPDELPMTQPHVGDRVAALVRDQAPDFAAFVRLPNGHESGLCRRFHTPQVEYISIDGAIAVDRVLRFEHLAGDFARLAAGLGIPGTLPHINRSRGGSDYRRCYDEETREMVRARFAADLARFGYGFC